ncbi:MAG: uroporphyrinogen-III C-methyltransferase [Leptolyngbya sp. LCM1.Bin17]|nr:MAG: uroporphyrinogen-III C-methyltransferase [Leptolyngbya sp. LCM1.Bin17]
MVLTVARPDGDITYGKVYLVGAGPGDPGLFTLKGKGLLECADVVIHDALVSAPILGMINPQAEVINAGKRRGHHSMLQPDINNLIMEKAKGQAVIVRLKGGDPFVFGRGGEEMAALMAAGIEVEVVPGITAGVAVPAYAGIPITHRDQSSSVTFVTGHEAAGKYRPRVNWQALAHGSETLVIYMGIRNLGPITRELLKAELRPETPVALIRWGTHPQQETLIGTLGTIVEQVAATGFEAPAIAVIGRVVDWHETFQHCRPSRTIWPH